MQFQHSHIRLVASRDTEQHTSAGAQRARSNTVAPIHAHTPEAPLLIALGLLLLAALVWVLWGVALIRDGGPNVSGLGVPPDADGGVPVAGQPLDPRVRTSEPRSETP